MKDVAQLWVIGKIKYSTLVVNQYLFYTVKFYLIDNNCNNLYLMLKQWENLRKDWDPTNLDLVIKFSTKPDKVEKLIQLIMDDKKAQDLTKIIHF